MTRHHKYRWIVLILVLSVWLSVHRCLAAEGQYRKRVEVQAATRLDWTFAVTRRSLVHPPADLVGDDYDSTAQSYEFFVPEALSAQDHLPLILHISSKDQADGWHRWEQVCRSKGFCFAGPHHAGAKQPLPRRIRTILDVLDDVRRRHTIDPDRTYIVGWSEGAHMACELGYTLPECFGGIIAINGGEAPPVPRWMQRRIAERLSVAFLSVERGKAATFTDAYFHPMAVAIGVESKHWQRYEGKAKYPTSDLLREVLAWVDQGAFRRREIAARYPSIRLGIDPLAREDQAAAVLVDANQRLTDEATLAAGLRELEGLQQRWPDLPEAASAKSLWLDFAGKVPESWEERRKGTLRIATKHRFALEYLHWKYLGIKSDVQFRDRSQSSHISSAQTVIDGRRQFVRGRKQLLRNYIEDTRILKWNEQPAEREALNDSVRFKRANVEIARRMGGMIAFDRQGQVCQLNLCGTQVTAKQLRTVKKQLSGILDLRALDLSSALMQESALREIADLRELRALSINHVEVSNRSLSSIKDLAQLQYLGLAFTNVSSFRHLHSFGELRWLFLGGSQIDDRALKQLASAKKLQHLSLFLCPITDAGVAHLATLPNLRTLNVALTKVSDACCQNLAQMQTLEELVLDDTQVTDDGLKILARLANLRHLSLEGLQVTDKGLIVTVAMKNLESLNVAKTQVTAQGIKEFRSALPQCRVQWNSDLTNYRAQQRVQRAHDVLLEKEAEVRRFSLRELQRRLLGVCLCSGEGFGG